MSEQASKLRETIDRMVEDAIRRILPQVMNEVLLKTIAGSGVMQEARRSAPQQPAPREQERVKVTSKAPPQPRPRGGRPDLSRLLDESAGSEFYERFNEPERVAPEPEPQAPLRERVAQNLRSLPPELRQMAEGMQIDDDDGEMWDDEPIQPRGDDAGDLGFSGKKVGVDFSRMQRALALGEQKIATAKPKVSADDARRNAEFEELRLKRMREKLDRPV